MKICALNDLLKDEEREVDEGRKKEVEEVVEVVVVKEGWSLEEREARV